MGKHSLVWDGPVGWRGVAIAGLITVAACGSRNSLPGGVAAGDDSTAGVGSGGHNNNAGIVTAQAVSAVSTGSAVSVGVSVTGSGGVGVTTGSIPSTTTTGVTTGTGGAPPCLGPGNVAGQGGEGGASSDTEMCPMPFCYGWVHKDANCAAIQGSFFFYSDQESGGSSYILSSLQNNLVCVAGEVGRVLDGQYGMYWGAGFGMNLNQSGFGYPAEYYDAEQQGVAGFGFSVDALPAGGELRFMVRGDGDLYCTSVITTGYTHYSLADLVKGCWDPASTPHEYSRLTSIEWHFVSNADTSYNFDVCLSELTVYRGPN